MNASADISVQQVKLLINGEWVPGSARFDVHDGRALCPPAYEPVAKFPVKVDDTGIWTRDDRD